ncbi:glutaredoxin family protein [Herbiconiux sp.]|uniref:glutaredoxin family protein n=1 Tax=Herbiconiux sp. TaxID=1871186 RepID=UPI0025BE4CA4|nr:glutaredoxin family protein [Herbiconiux sp.]
MPAVDLALIGKPGCHLCDDAREVVRSVIASLDGEVDVSMTELSILDDPALLHEFAEEIPVVTIGGRVHTIWRVEPARLRTALLEAAP